MSVADGTEPRHEIVIVRRAHSDHDEGHHGGAWKIAFADFMTAMMCFFLVMWLISAANEQTKAAVASYFNPVKLVDRNASRKGLEELGDGPNSVGLTAESPQEASGKAGTDGRGNAGPATEQNSRDSAHVVKRSDEHLFNDPYAVLAEIAQDTGTKANVSERGEGGAQNAGPSSGASGGEAYRDPFAPDFWTEQVATPIAEASAERAAIEGDPAKPGDKTERSATPEPVKAPEPKPEAAEQRSPLDIAPGALARDGAKPGDAPKAETAEAEAMADKPKPRDAAPSEHTIGEADAIRRELAEAIKSGKNLPDGLSVVATDKGVVISVTEQFDFGMFEIGSAVPRKQLVLAMEKIARTIAAHEGNVSINGHTDARPFRGGGYDNWRLSTARAHSAYYMLVRAGLDEKRIVEVAGFADRKLKDTAEPFSATNRRIEILLERAE
ncbi:chemotaxis protein MotB [Aminobacter niigataensis]|uniref:Chemotaxis protein MotB n=1 Tax=Aminobacter niigataensis TaxID=83265 RepID=A0ABR6L7P4_9HYPH|nr:MotB family protein [Aminobacter niigataensis]MBB4652823.1 chemotaxis protein MotB [Aminobacter niigataensis]